MPFKNKEDRNRYMRERRSRQIKPSKLSNEEIVQKIHAFLYSEEFPDPDDIVCNTLALAHIFRGSFSPSREEIAYVRSRFKDIPSNVDVKLQETRQKIIYRIMSKF